MSRIVKISIVAVVLITAIFITFKYQYYKNHIIDNNGAKNELTNILNTGNENVDLKDELSFKWTEAYVFDPYTPDKKVKEEINNKWIAPTTSFISFVLNKETDYLIQDTDKRIVFINNDKVVKDIIYNKQNFDILNSHFHKNDTLILVDSNQYKVK